MSNRVEDLHPCFQPVWRKVLADGQAALDLQYPGSKVVTTETARPIEDQAKDVAAGLSDVKIGWHQYGLASDFEIIDENGNQVTDGTDPRYALIGGIAAAQGCHYPIILSHGEPDHDHVEWHPGFTLAIYQAWLAQHPPPVLT